MSISNWKAILAIPVLFLVCFAGSGPRVLGQNQETFNESSSVNNIVVENTLPGTDEDQIAFNNSATFGEVEAYGSALSLRPGETLSIFARSAGGALLEKPAASRCPAIPLPQMLYQPRKHSQPPTTAPKNRKPQLS